MTDLAASGLRRRSPETWTRARDDYAAGMSAPEVCARHELAVSTFRARAAREGWWRTDQADPAPAGPDELDELDADPAEPSELAEIAWAEVARAVRRGRLVAARGWTGLTRELRAMAEAQAAATALQAEKAAANARPRADPVLAMVEDKLGQSRERLLAALQADAAELGELDEPDELDCVSVHSAEPQRPNAAHPAEPKDSLSRCPDPDQLAPKPPAMAATDRESSEALRVSSTEPCDLGPGAELDSEEGLVEPQPMLPPLPHYFGMTWQQHLARWRANRLLGEDEEPADWEAAFRPRPGPAPSS